MGEKLQNPPVIEALCEFRFDKTFPWDWTIPGRLYNRIGNKFQERSEVTTMGLEIKAEGRIPLAIHTAPERIQFRRSDGSALVQVGPHLLVINYLLPYRSWKDFRKLIVDIYKEHEGVKEPGRIEKVGLRYINQLEVSESQFKIGDYITLNPPLKNALHRPVHTFYQRYELLYDQPHGVLIHQSGINKTERRTFLMLDLEFVSVDLSNIDVDEVIVRWLDDAHDRIEEAFIVSLIPKLYEQLKRGGGT